MTLPLLKAAAALAATTVLFLLLAMASAAHSTTTIVATVIDAHSNVPLAGAQISAYTTSSLPFQETISDNNGQFKLRDLKVGHYRLKVTKSGYQAMAYSLDVTSTDKMQSAGRLPMYRTSDPPLSKKQNGMACDRPMETNQTADISIICS